MTRHWLNYHWEGQFINGVTTTWAKQLLSEWPQRSVLHSSDLINDEIHHPLRSAPLFDDRTNYTASCWPVSSSFIPMVWREHVGKWQMERLQVVKGRWKVWGENEQTENEYSVKQRNQLQAGSRLFNPVQKYLQLNQVYTRVKLLEKCSDMTLGVWWTSCKFFLQSFSLISHYANINHHYSRQMLHISKHFINCSRWSEKVPPPNYFRMLEIIIHYLTTLALCAANKWVFHYAPSTEKVQGRTHSKVKTINHPKNPWGTCFEIVVPVQNWKSNVQTPNTSWIQCEHPILVSYIRFAHSFKKVPSGTRRLHDVSLQQKTSFNSENDSPSKQPLRNLFLALVQN